ncbi:hypothetical protein CFK38_01800 [Brachybacterium vulturis]|uniref:cysteine-S-conjugate beta-lyase n=1 Tax=Brachybacterium vulturis TaxID=2017484 RepID=A0A291GJL6_9MICO|nr:aminotransferase class I/II-fold pyridoxal phosphate-dependent enzyme [Brachybacterium vulturis]ATG50397.1 hypothetical protein CFK38_01800 [Brachybacterium vulturis]
MIQDPRIDSSVHGRLLRGGDETTIPLHVAELQFPTAEPIIEELTALGRTGEYGYTESHEDFELIVQDWCRRRHRWEIEPQHVLLVPRVVHLLALLARTRFPRPPVVVTLSPQYGPTLEVLQRNGCEIRTVPLVESDGTWAIDMDGLAAELVGADVLLLCSPHNPTGTVWPREVLESVAGHCAAHDVLVVADEVHCDSVREGAHVPFGAVARNGQRWLSCIAPGKAFNLAGLETSAVICSDPELVHWLKTSLRAGGFHNAGVFGLRALKVAWTECDQWLDRTQARLQSVMDRACAQLREKLPGLRPVPTGGTFLLWIDARAVGDEHELRRWFVDEARVIPGFGSDFGAAHDGWLRLNLGVTEAALDDVLERLVRTAPVAALPTRAG